MIRGIFCTKIFLILKIGQIVLILFIPHEGHFMASPFIIIKLMASASAFAPTKPNTYSGLLS